MPANLTQLLQLQEENLLKFGTFTLRNGDTSNYYCDIKEVFGNPSILGALALELAQIVPQESTCIAGSGYGGITLASLVAQTRTLPLTLVRDKAKEHGTLKTIEGYLPGVHDTVCIVDDVFTTGSSITHTKNILRETGAQFAESCVVLDRSDKKSVLSLITERDIVGDSK